MSELRVAVYGATGYIGMQCVALVAAHPELELACITARTHAGRRYSDVVPGSTVDMVLEDRLEARGVDVVLAALPHTVAASAAAEWLDAGAIVVDLSADFRLRDAGEYESWYGVSHPAPELCADAVYGLPELAGDALTGADLIAAPGCYPTAALLATVPAVRELLVEPDVVVDAKSGVSGAGRSASVGSLFAEVNESVHAYAVAGHRHRPEMVQALEDAAGVPVRCTFVPHLVPMTRGILATAYLRPLAGPGEIEACYRGFAAAHPCLRYDEQPPRTKSVLGTNLAAINVSFQDSIVVVTVAIDNLVKGAAGQGVQALNLRCGFEETAGLPLQAAWP